MKQNENEFTNPKLTKTYKTNKQKKTNSKLLLVTSLDKTKL